MNTNPSAYDTHNTSTHPLPTSDRDLEDPDVTFHTYGNNASFTAQFLNTEYWDEIRKISPEIYTESRLDGEKEKFTEGTLHIEIRDSAGNVLAERTADISDLGHSVKPGYGFVPYVKFPKPTHYSNISSIHIFINPTA